ncbi:hypothetical protein M2277_005077 [Paenibacillus sp. LBL]|uniref:hypothetical protein n=1 Tax=Paenibacillus sp. LBL TaxID=2940563 RepID=UPI00247551D1|nr:hypothetical protein [Paenibacillus sp. LBL]MDH6674385.1 hypothetical protein [Paenibacillus sp. LBL]
MSKEIEQLLKEKKLKESLLELRAAFNKVNRLWDEAYDTYLICDEYPFETDFDNMTCLVNGWVDANTKDIIK